MNRYFIFDHGTYTSMWSVEETTIPAGTEKKQDGCWMYFQTPRNEEGAKVVAVRRELFNKECEAYDAAARSADLTIAMGEEAIIHHVTGLHPITIENM